MDAKEKAHFRHLLLERRRQILEVQRTADRSWQDLQLPEVELEETAQKENLSQGLDQLGERELAEIQAIDAALGKIDEGTYGICESCGRPISKERLEVVPWAEICIRCAQKRTEGRPLPSTEIESLARRELPPEYQGMSDAQLREAVYDVLRTDGRIELEELDIFSKEGTIYLEGALPSEKKRRLLLQILEDVVDLPAVVDHLEINPLLWQRKDRTPPEELSTREYQEELWEEEGEKEDVAANAYEARKTGASFTPPDKLVPEKNE